MSSSYNGVSTGIAPRDAVTITNPSDGDALSAASNNVATQTLANILKFLQERTLFNNGYQNIPTTANTHGCYARGTGSGSGGLFYTDVAAPDGVAALNGLGAGPNNIGVWAHGTGNQPAVYARALASGYGVDSESASGLAGIFKRTDAGADSLLETLRVVNGFQKFNGNNPAATQGYTNSLLGANIVKAWGCLSIDPPGTVTVNAGFNIGAPTVVGGGPNYLRVPFATGLATANYAVLITPMVKAIQGVSLLHWNACNLATGQFDAAASITNTAAQVDLTASATQLSFVVLGFQ